MFTVPFFTKIASPSTLKKITFWVLFSIGFSVEPKAFCDLEISQKALIKITRPFVNDFYANQLDSLSKLWNVLVHENPLSFLPTLARLGQIPHSQMILVLLYGSADAYKHSTHRFGHETYAKLMFTKSFGSIMNDVNTFVPNHHLTLLGHDIVESMKAILAHRASLQDLENPITSAAIAEKLFSILLDKPEYAQHHINLNEQYADADFIDDFFSATKAVYQKTNLFRLKQLIYRKNYKDWYGLQIRTLDQLIAAAKKPKNPFKAIANLLALFHRVNITPKRDQAH